MQLLPKSFSAKKSRRRFKDTSIPFSLGMSLVTLGVVYGDIGTSPMYTLKAIIDGNGGLSTINENVILGVLSLMIWTLTLITTLKYVAIAMRADNHNEGGIFALYALVKRSAPWLIIPAMIGGAALLADGILTPAVTVTSAVEGLRTTSFGFALLGNDQGRVILITLIILSALFAVQRAGTSSVGKAFGPIMIAWFGFLAISGLVHIVGNLAILRAFNPVYGIEFLFSHHNKAGLMVLGFVFLTTTGAEALYSDMGHVGKFNIFATWPFVKAALILNYIGQGAWVLANVSNEHLAALPDMNPFYEMLPIDLRPFAVVLSTIAAIIASQALITGSYTLVSEATRLDLLPHLQIAYPSQTKGQLYIPLVNSVMWVGCIFVVLFFQSSQHMEAAYGLAITLTMLMTSLLLFVYIRDVMKKPIGSYLFIAFFGLIEFIFFGSSLTKFFHGGFVTVFMALLLFAVMFVWRHGSAIERAQSVYLPVKDYIGQLLRLKNDDAHTVLADNLVFLTNDASFDKLDRDILYSILDKRPKRARAYWFLNVRVTDQPYTHAYTVNSFGTDFIFKVQLQLGFKVNQRVNAYLRQVVNDLIDSGELAAQERRYSIYLSPGHVGDFRFCMLRKMLVPESGIRMRDVQLMTLKYGIRRLCGSPARWYGLENSSIMIEYVPLFSRVTPATRLERLSLSVPESEHLRPRATGNSQILPVIHDTVHEAMADEDIFSQQTTTEISHSIEEVTQSVIGGETAEFKALNSDDFDDEYSEEDEFKGLETLGDLPENTEADSK